MASTRPSATRADPQQLHASTRGARTGVPAGCRRAPRDWRVSERHWARHATKFADGANDLARTVHSHATPVIAHTQRCDGSTEAEKRSARAHGSIHCALAFRDEDHTNQVCASFRCDDCRIRVLCSAYLRDRRRLRCCCCGGGGGGGGGSHRDASRKMRARFFFFF